jgi:hypothetical protein
MSNDIDSNFEWTLNWKKQPRRCIHLTQNAYECVLNTLEQAFASNQATVKSLMAAKQINIERLDQELHNGVQLKLSISELKQLGETA